MGLGEELAELAQMSPVLCKDGRTGGTAKMWVTDWIWKREVIDNAEAVEIQTRMGLTHQFPTYPLPVVSWTLLQRVPTVPV